MIWAAFIVAIMLLIALDLGVFNRNAHVITVKEAGLWTGLWVSLAMFFSLGIFHIYKNGLIHNVEQLSAADALLTYVTGYLVELSLSVDNIFVIAVIFSSFKIPLEYQHRVLFWGILGAIVFRGIMILFGVTLIHKFSWMIYLFGIFLLYTAYKMLKSSYEDYNPRKSFVFRQLRKFVPITQKIEGEKFFIKVKHIHAATPLFIALVVIEVTDVLFALDSIPAILAITSDPFLVFSSNIMAIMGLRSMYFFLSNMLKKFEYLHYSLIVILSFVGIKMLLSHVLYIPQWVSLLFILFSICSGVSYSLYKVSHQAEA